MFDVLSPSLLALQQKYGSGCSEAVAGGAAGAGLSSGSERVQSPDDDMAMDSDPPGVRKCGDCVRTMQEPTSDQPSCHAWVWQ